MIAGVTWQTSADLVVARQCAKELDLPLLKWSSTNNKVVLAVTANCIGLIDTMDNSLPVDCGWGDARLQSRYQKSIKQDSLARACGLDINRQINIVDGTGGFGRDAWLLAAWGAQVKIIEKDKIMFWLLQQSWHKEQQESAAIGRRLSIHETNCVDFFTQTKHQSCDVVYLDPMFPFQRRKKIKNNKRMALLQTMFSTDLTTSTEQLLQVALKFARYRVVLKKPRIFAVIPPANMDVICSLYQLMGSSNRFDVYTKRSLKYLPQ